MDFDFKKQYQEKLQAELQEMQTEYDKLKAEWSKLPEGDEKKDAWNHMHDVAVMMAQAKSKSNDLQKAPDSTWEQLKAGAESYWIDVKHAFSRLSTMVSNSTAGVQEKIKSSSITESIASTGESLLHRVQQAGETLKTRMTGASSEAEPSAEQATNLSQEEIIEKIEHVRGISETTQLEEEERLRREILEASEMEREFSNTQEDLDKTHRLEEKERMRRISESKSLEHNPYREKIVQMIHDKVPPKSAT